MVRDYLDNRSIVTIAIVASLILVLASNHTAYAQLAPGAPTIKSPITGSTVDTNSFTISGTANPDVDIFVLDENGNLVGDATSNSQGFWTLNTLPIPHGSHTLTAQVVNSQGLISLQSAGLTITINSKLSTPITPTNALPAVPIITTIPSSLNQADNSPVIEGTAEVGVTVQLFDGTTSVGSSATDGEGHWEISTSALTDGSHTLTATTTNTFGTSASSSSITITINTSTGAVSVNIPTITTGAGNSANITPTISGTADPGVMIQLLDENGNTIGSGLTDPQGKWSVTTIDLAPGSHTITAQATDDRGDSAVSSPINLTISESNIPLAPNITSPEDNSTEDILQPEITGTGISGDKIVVYDGKTPISTNPGTIIVGTDGNWFATPSSSLSAGPHVIKAMEVRGDKQSAFSTPAIVTLSSGASFSAPTIPVINQPSILTTNPQTLSGTGGANDKISLFDENGNDIADSTASGTGAWSVSVALSDGAHTLTATDSSSLGISYSNPVNVQVITAAASSLPPSPTITADNTFETTSPMITGSAALGVIVDVFDGGILIGETQSNPTTGDWSVGVSLAGGSHTLTATATNTAGTSAASASSSVTILTVPSTPTITTSGALTTQTPTISGTADNNVAIILLDENGNILGTTNSNPSTGAWSITTTTLGNGPHTLTATASNFIGVSSSSAAASITILVSGAPGVPVITAPTGALTIQTPTITGTSPTGLTVTLLDQNGNSLGTGSSGTGSWSITTSTLPNGITTLRAKVASGGITTTSAPVSVIVDAAGAPSVPIIATSTNTEFNTVTPVISGTADPSVTINLFDGAVNIGSTTSDATSGSWSITTSTLSNGAHSLSAQASSGGVLSEFSGSVNVIISIPGFPSIPNITTADDSAFASTAPTIEGTSDPGATINLLDTNGNNIGTATADGTTGHWSIITSSLSNGEHNVSVTATNGAGTSTQSDPVHILIDTTGSPPVPILITPFGFNFSSNTPTIIGTASPGITVTVKDGSTTLGTVVADATTGFWVFKSSSAVADGTHSITASATSPGGNSTSSATTVTTVTTSPPVTVSTPSSISPPNGSIISSPVTISGTADPGDVIKVTDASNGNALVGAAVADPTGSWSVTTTPFNPGSHTINVQASNPAGSATTTITLTL